MSGFALLKDGFYTSGGEGKVQKLSRSIFLCLLFSFIFLLYFVRYEGPAESYWDTFISMTASHMVDRPVEFVDEKGLPLYHFRLSGKLPENLVDRSTFGIISKDQRIGASVLHSVWFLFFNLLGFRIFFAVCGVSLAVTGYLIGRLFFSMPLSVFCSILVSVNPYTFSCYQLSPSLTGSAILCLLLYLTLQERSHEMAIGLTYGAALAVLEVSIFFLPAILFYFWVRKCGASRYLYFLLGMTLLVAPLLYWNEFAFGGMFIHPTQYPEFVGHRPTFPHRILFWTFQFNGLLNFPFHSHVVRTPHFPYPGFIFIPLVLTRCFGILLTAMSVPGFWWLWKRSKTLTLFFLFWCIPFTLFFLFQENLDEWKISYTLLLFPPLALFTTAGLKRLVSRVEPAKSLLLYVGGAMVLFVGVRSLRHIESPIDTRWYLRFPKALNTENRGIVLNEDERFEWYIYHTDETPEEHEKRKEKMTEANLLPARYLERKKRDWDMSKGIVSEWMTDRIRTCDMWEKIYGSDPHRVNRGR